ncbi:MAG: GDP-mannose 4,6-dehydratase [Phycisphaerales bacterium]|nr:GDP-mannose 4,6-dehydratase [Phycisphaerales bacterium]
MPGTDTTSPNPAGARAGRVLITGGAGFIGSHLVESLLASGDRVTVIDDLSTGREQNLPAEHPRLRFIRADLAHALDSLGELERFDEVYHLAAAVGVKRVMDRPIESIETNVLQTSAVLRFASEHGTGERGARTLIASSSEVYGKADKSPFSEDDDVVYGPTSVIRWSYACSKAIDEHLTIAHHRRRGLPAVIARFFNTVGPRQVGEYGMVLPRFVGAALLGEPLVVHGDGTQSRCFADVRDVAGALPKLLRTDGCIGGVFNLGADEPITIKALAELVVSTLESSSTIELAPYSDVYPEGFEDLRQRRPDLSRIKNAIGYAPAIGLKQTIRDLAASMREARS